MISSLLLYGLLLLYHHVGGAAAGVQLPLLEPVFLSSLPTSLRGEEGKGERSQDIL